MSAQNWTLLPGGNDSQATFGYGDGLIEAQTTADGDVCFSGALFDELLVWEPEEMQKLLDALTRAACGYWYHVPGAQWCLEEEERP